MGERFWKTLVLGLIVILVGLVIYLGHTTAELRVKGSHQPNYSQPASFRAPLMAGDDVGGNIYWVADLVDKALPFVVNVRTSTRPEIGPDKSEDSGPGMYKELPNEDRGMERGDSFEWFREQFPWLDIPEQEFQHPPIQGVASGFIVSEKGHVVTNAHVVQGMDEVTITLSDGREFDGELVGTDNLKDIAVLKINARDLAVAPLGDSEAVRIGEPAVAIGSPFGLEATVTQGIISTTARDPRELAMEMDARRVKKLIQTDASINQGNSGGPLLNARGEVIGVNQAILPYAKGIGFAIPINEIKDTIDQIIKEGKVSYPGLGVTVQDVTKENHEELRIDVTSGAYVVQVNVDSPADRAHIEAGDVILKLNDVEIHATDELITEIDRHKVGDKVTLLIARGGSKDKLKKAVVILGELDQSEFRPGG
jgi:serine protease Do